MKPKATSKTYYTFISLIFLTSSFAQPSTPFKTRYQGVVKGEMIVIANNIVNREDTNNTSNDGYYNHSSSSRKNDEWNMKYIDIDNDKTTFSSSSAELFFEKPENKKIVYAGLYWAATYKYNEGTVNEKQKLVAKDPSREAFNTIKIKLPNSQSYSDITGEIIYDAIEDKEQKESAPYAVYADITQDVQSLTNPTGVYTVANIRATQGILREGVAGGWTIVFVFEEESKSQKAIITKDGFATSSTAPTDIVFDGFEAPGQGNVKTKIACAALEGDINETGDQLFLSGNKTNTFTPLENSIRKNNNFFNSCITTSGQYYIDRYPNSKNTLGYDTFLESVTNTKNSLIENGSKEVTARLISTGDKTAVFWVGLSIELAKEPNQPEEPEIIQNNKSKIKFVTPESVLLADGFQSASEFNRRKNYSEIRANKEQIEIQTITISGHPSAYYMIANIYKSEEKARAFIDYLKEEKIRASYFINPLNNYNYVYVENVSSQKEALQMYKSKLNNRYKESLQILAVNKNRESLIAEANALETALEAPKEEKSPFDIKVVSIPNEPKGYYIIANVFEIEENTTKFVNELKTKGFNPKILLNPATKYKYVYLMKAENELEAISMKASKKIKAYQGKTWILSVNNKEKQ